MSNYAKELDVALDIIKKVGDFQLEKQATLKKINLKEDRSPVTEVDEASEAMIKDAFAAAFPEDGFFGEETGQTAGTNGRRWIVDPLDGTRPYIHKIPTYSTLIALEEDGEIVVAAVNFPGLGETYWATRGGGAFCNGQPIAVSKTAALGDAMGSALGAVEESHTDRGQRTIASLRQMDYIYGFMDAYSYMSVAAGKLDCCIALIDYPWDRAPAALIVEEAGGVYTTLEGERTIYGESFMVSNGAVQEELLESLQ